MRNALLESALLPAGTTGPATRNLAATATDPIVASALAQDCGLTALVRLLAITTAREAFAAAAEEAHRCWGASIPTGLK